MKNSAQTFSGLRRCFIIDSVMANTEGENRITENRSRIVWIDIMRGFLMFWVIFGHITEEPDQYIYIYSFFPRFFPHVIHSLKEETKLIDKQRNV